MSGPTEKSDAKTSGIPFVTAKQLRAAKDRPLLFFYEVQLATPQVDPTKPVSDAQEQRLRDEPRRLYFVGDSTEGICTMDNGKQRLAQIDDADIVRVAPPDDFFGTIHGWIPMPKSGIVPRCRLMLACDALNAGLVKAQEEDDFDYDALTEALAERKAVRRAQVRHRIPDQVISEFNRILQCFMYNGGFALDAEGAAMTTKPIGSVSEHTIRLAYSDMLVGGAPMNVVVVPRYTVLQDLIGYYETFSPRPVNIYFYDGDTTSDGRVLKLMVTVLKGDAK